MVELVPNPARRTVSPTMAARGLRSAADLAAGKPCGTRVRYYAGCRCQACRAANTAYARERQAARARGEGNHIVSAEPAREHLAWLSAQGVGHKTAADAAKVAGSIVTKIVYGQRTKIRAQTERRILAVTVDTAMDGARIDAAPTKRLLAELRACGYTNVVIASELLGRRVRGLQIGKSPTVEVRTAALVRALHERWRCVPEKRTRELLRELSEEGFHRDRVAAELLAMARARGWDAPDLAARKDGVVTARAAELVEALHFRWVEDGAVA